MITVQWLWCAAELSSEKGRHQFLHDETNLAEPGELYRNSTYEFAFDARKPHESYAGTNVLLRYVQLTTAVSSGKNFRGMRTGEGNIDTENGMFKTSRK